MKAVIIDDEYPALDELTYLLKQHQAEVSGAFTDPAEGFAFITKQQPDVVFLDIDMPGMNGIELGIKIQNILPEIILVFVTAYSQYALNAFKAYPLDYILKPIDEERFNKTIEHIGNILNEEKNAPEVIPSIRCFGKMEVTVGNETVKFPTQKTRELLAYLICSVDSPTYRDEIIHFLFGDEDEKKGANNLRVTLYRLRNAFAAAGIKKDQLLIKEDYSLIIHDGVCDYIDFCRFVGGNSAIDRNNLLEAVKISDSFSGELLNNIDTLWVSEKREWVQIKAEKLIMNLSLYFIAKKEMGKAEKHLLHLLNINPLSEHGYATLLDLLIETGDKQKYSYYYSQYAQFLKEESCGVPSKKHTEFLSKII